LCLGARVAVSQTHLVIVSGLGGEKRYVESFATMAQTLADAANKRLGIPDAEICGTAKTRSRRSRSSRDSRPKANVEKAMRDLAARSKPGDQVVLVLIGHGSGDGENTKISIPGPDLSAGDFARLLGPFSAQKVAFVNLTSASGDMLPVLSAPNRVVITATKSAFERNESHFAQFFVDAFAKDVADADKDGRVSLLEAFRYAATETKRVYETDTKLQTEHAQFDDIGAKAGVAEPDGRTTQGLLARRFFLDAGAGAGGARLASNDPQLAALYKDKYAIEEQIDALRIEEGVDVRRRVRRRARGAAGAARAEGEERFASWRGGNHDSATRRLGDSATRRTPDGVQPNLLRGRFLDLMAVAGAPAVRRTMGMTCCEREVSGSDCVACEGAGVGQRLDERAEGFGAGVCDDWQVRRGGELWGGRATAARRMGVARCGTRSARSCCCGEAGGGGERVRARGDGPGQPDRGAQPGDHPLRSRRARSGDEGVRSLHRRLQQVRRVGAE
jgi:hypothetical protein